MSCEPMVRYRIIALRRSTSGSFDEGSDVCLLGLALVAVRLDVQAQPVRACVLPKTRRLSFLTGFSIHACFVTGPAVRSAVPAARAASLSGLVVDQKPPADRVVVLFLARNHFFNLMRKPGRIATI